MGHPLPLLLKAIQQLVSCSYRFIEKQNHLLKKNKTGKRLQSCNVYLRIVASKWLQVKIGHFFGWGNTILAINVCFKLQHAVFKNGQHLCEIVKLLSCEIFQLWYMYYFLAEKADSLLPNLLLFTIDDIMFKYVQFL